MGLVTAAYRTGSHGDPDKLPVVDDAACELGSLTSIGITVRPERCCRVRNRHVSCRRCADACTSHAIVIDDAQLRVDPSVCVGCGTCATVCPTCALETQHPSDREIIALAGRALRENGGEVVVACHKALERARDRVAPERVVGLVCLSRMEESLATALLAHGAESIHLVCDDCASCPREAGRASADLVADTMRRLLDCWGVDRAYTIETELPASVLWEGGEAGDASSAAASDGAREASASADATGAQSAGKQDEDAASPRALRAALDADARRRLDLLVDESDVALVERPEVIDGTVTGKAARPAAAATAPWRVTRVQPDGTLPHFVPARRQRLLDNLAALGEPQGEVLETRLWGHVVLDESRCRSCLMCTVFCPTGALTSYTDEDGSIGIEHYALECVHCKTCQDICPGSAIVCEAQVPLKTLTEGRTERHKIPDPVWKSGPNQILSRMRSQIGGMEVALSYGTE